MPGRRLNELDAAALADLTAADLLYMLSAGAMDRAVSLSVLQQFIRPELDQTPINGMQLYYTMDGSLAMRLAQHMRFARTTGTVNVPTLAQFQAGSSAESDVIEVLGVASVMYLHFADIADELEFIGVAGANNARAAFGPAVALADQLNGVTYYSYSSRFPLFRSAANVEWEIRQ